MSAPRDGTPATADRRPGRAWETLPPEQEPIGWEFDDADGVIHGPLDLAFFDGRTLLLHLAPGQVALLVSGGNLRAVYLEGAHALRIGGGNIPPSCELLFLAADRPLSVSWDQRQSLWLPDDSGQPVRTPVSGGCSCVIDDAARFFAAFLRFGGGGGGEPLTLQVIDCLIRSRIEETLGDFCRTGSPDAAARQAFVDSLRPADMDPGLQQLGLACTRLAVQLPPPSVERLASGQSAGMGFNSPH